MTTTQYSISNLVSQSQTRRAELEFATINASVVNVEILNIVAQVFSRLRTAWQTQTQSLHQCLAELEIATGRAIEQKHIDQINSLYSIPKLSQLDTFNQQLIESFNYHSDDTTLTLTITFNRILDNVHSIVLPIELWTIPQCESDAAQATADAAWATAFDRWQLGRIDQTIASIKAQLEITN